MRAYSRAGWRIVLMWCESYLAGAIGPELKVISAPGVELKPSLESYTWEEETGNENLVAVKQQEEAAQKQEEVVNQQEEKDGEGTDAATVQNGEGDADGEDRADEDAALDPFVPLNSQTFERSGSIGAAGGDSGILPEEFTTDEEPIEIGAPQVDDEIEGPKDDAEVLIDAKVVAPAEPLEGETATITGGGSRGTDEASFSIEVGKDGAPVSKEEEENAGLDEGEGDVSGGSTEKDQDEGESRMEEGEIEPEAEEGGGGSFFDDPVIIIAIAVGGALILLILFAALVAVVIINRR